MSRTPSNDGVKKLRAALKRYRDLSAKAFEARAVAATVSRLEDGARAAHREILDSLESMDVRANGNAGWESRILSFLSELDRQASEEPRT